MKMVGGSVRLANMHDAYLVGKEARSGSTHSRASHVHLKTESRLAIYMNLRNGSIWSKHLLELNSWFALVG